MKLSKNLIFVLAFSCGLVVTLGFVFSNRPRETPWEKAHLLTSGIYVTEQISERDVPAIRKGGFATIVDLRPDGEAPDQVPSGTMERVAHINHLNFSYIPVQHGAIPDAAVAALGDAITKSPKPILLYCRSGKRAARTFSLVEASRTGGPDAATILAMVHTVGQSADDLAVEINQRIAQRKPATGASR